MGKKENFKIEKERITVSFDPHVLKALQERAKKTNTSLSNLVNFLCRHYVLSDATFYEAMAKHHYMKFQEFNYQKERAQIIVEKGQ